ncbi:MAG: hypothetical protein QOE60_2669 [Thermoleophilaceae bacterium]|nr:hypothetical protein [Thermoleophilaceae bacterium]
MGRCTLSRTFVCCLLLLAGCGSDDDPGVRTERFARTPLNRPAESGRETRHACSLISARRIARVLRVPRVRATPNDSTDLSICDWRDGGKRVQLVVDAAPRAQLRYYNQLAEQLQFHNPEPARRPYQLEHVGDDDAYGGAGAWWTLSKGQLVAYADERILRVRAPTRREAVRVARLAFRRLSEPGP